MTVHVQKEHGKLRVPRNRSLDEPVCRPQNRSRKGVSALFQFSHYNQSIMRQLSTTPATQLVEGITIYLQRHNSLYAAVLGGILCLLLSWKVLSRSVGGLKAAGLPIVDEGQWWDVFNLQPKFNFYLDGRRGLEKAYEKACGKPFRMLGIGALVTILPPQYADEIRNDKNLDFSKVVSKVGSPVLSSS